MKAKQKQFDKQLDSLILLKELLVKRNEFDEIAQREYQVVRERHLIY